MSTQARSGSPTHSTIIRPGLTPKLASFHFTISRPTTTRVGAFDLYFGMRMQHLQFASGKHFLELSLPPAAAEAPAAEEAAATVLTAGTDLVRFSNPHIVVSSQLVGESDSRPLVICIDHFTTEISEKYSAAM